MQCSIKNQINTFTKTSPAQHDENRGVERPLLLSKRSLSIHATIMIRKPQRELQRTINNSINPFTK
jgi:hypothetical protein